MTTPRATVLTFVSGHDNVGRLLEVLADEVAQRVVLLHQDEVGRVGHA